LVDVERWTEMRAALAAWHEGERSAADELAAREAAKHPPKRMHA
jgi:hypothetical protein